MSKVDEGTRYLRVVEPDNDQLIAAVNAGVEFNKETPNFRLQGGLDVTKLYDMLIINGQTLTHSLWLLSMLMTRVTGSSSVVQHQ